MVVTRPTVPQVVPIARAYYGLPGNGVGGSLHIVLDDENVQDSHVDFCIQQAVDTCDHPGYMLGCILRKMTRTQRAKVSDRIGVIDFASTEKDFWDAVDAAGLPKDVLA